MSRNGSDAPDRDEAEGVTGRPVPPNQRSGDEPDVYLNVPQLKVEEITLEVEDLQAHVSLSAEVLDLLKLNVGADVALGRVDLEIKGVEAQALLEVRLDNVAVIVDRVLTTLDRNPEILQHIGRGVESAASELGKGTGTAVGEVGRGARGAVEDVGRGAGGAVEDVGRGAGGAVEDVGRGAGGAVKDVGSGAGGAVKDVGRGTGEAVDSVGSGAGDAARDVGEGAGDAAKDVGSGAGDAAKEAGGAVRDVGSGAGEAAKDVGSGTREAARAPDAENEADAHEDPGSAINGEEPNSENSESERKSEQPDASDAEQQQATALQDAFHETEESVRDLGRALIRMLRSSGGGDRA